MRLSIRLTHGKRCLSVSDFFIAAAGIVAVVYGALSTWFLWFYFKSDTRKGSGADYLEPQYGLRLIDHEMRVYLKVCLRYRLAEIEYRRRSTDIYFSYQSSQQPT